MKTPTIYHFKHKTKMYTKKDRIRINNALSRIEDTYRDIYEILAEYPEHQACEGKNGVLPSVSGSALLTDLLKAQQEIISNPLRFNGVAIEDIKRIFADYGIKYDSPF